jgi:hypothetical protein
MGSEVRDVYNPDPLARGRVRAELIADPARSNRLVAIAASASPTTVVVTRRSLIEAGVIYAAIGAGNLRAYTAVQESGGIDGCAN